MIFVLLFREKTYIIFSIAGSFELAVLRMSRYIDLGQNCVLYGDTLLPEEAFFTNDTLENKLVSLAFEVSRGIAEYKLTEVELALYSAVVLLSPGSYVFNLFFMVIVALD